MLKRVITFEDFNGDTVTETHYFNLTKTELVELEAEYEGGLEGYMQAIIDAKDNKTLLAEFKKIILMSYGVKSPDGKRFIKSTELREEFSQTAAFDALFMELASSEDAGASFIASIIPRDLGETVAKADLKAEVAEKMGIREKTTAEIAAEQRD